uniref:Uncharacterized protein n=1 Tax=Arundo donax TaxID=35708 RepID=A0A0A9GPE5_ARUDO
MILDVEGILVSVVVVICAATCFSFSISFVD